MKGFSITNNMSKSVIPGCMRLECLNSEWRSKSCFIVHVDVRGRKNELEWQKLPKKKKKRQVVDVKAELSKEDMSNRRRD